MTDLELAIAAARGAGAILRQAFATELEVSYKSADQPVTAADYAADTFLRESLLGSRPDYGWISEESDTTAAGADAPSWVIDPLDGTRNFVEKRPEFAVCIGLLARGTPTLGVVYNPVAGVLYTGTRGGGAFQGNRPITARPRRKERPVLVASVEELARGQLDGFRDLCEIQTLGSTALKMACVAEGGADLYISRSRKGIWDVCAAAVIATEGGAMVLSAAGQPLDYTHPSSKIEGLIVVGAESKEEVPRWIEHLRVDDRHPEKEK